MYLWGAKTSHYAYSFGSALEPARKPPYSISKSIKQKQVHILHFKEPYTTLLRLTFHDF